MRDLFQVRRIGPTARLRRAWLAAGLLFVASGGFPPSTAGSQRLGLSLQTIPLPGPPAALVESDLDRDGDLDLAVVVAFTEFEEIGIDRVEGMVEMITIIPALFDRRELHAFLREDDGTYRPAGAPLRLPLEVLNVEAGPGDWPLSAVTDAGLSRIRLVRGPNGLAPALEPVLREPTVLAGCETFLSRLRVVHDLDGDGDGDVLFPSRRGPAVFLAGKTGLGQRASQRLEELPVPRRGRERAYPFPEVRDVNGDGEPDLVLRHGAPEREPIHVLLGDGAGRFLPLRSEPADCRDETGTGLRWNEPSSDDGRPWPRDGSELRDVDGDGRVEMVTWRQLERGDGFRNEMKDAKRPVYRYGFHRVLGDALEVEREPYATVETEGHVFDEAPEELALEAFDDLDGDGLQDLVTVTLDFSVLQALRVLTTKRISIGVDFRVWCQEPGGAFRRVEGLDLSEKLKFDLNDLSLARFAQFAGDFDGDGRKDFVHLGRGRNLTIHRGAPACRYPREPDLVVELAREPDRLELVQIRDLDGDGRSDVVVTRPLDGGDADATPPVALDLYLSGGGR